MPTANQDLADQKGRLKEEVTRPIYSPTSFQGKFDQPGLRADRLRKTGVRFCATQLG